MLTVKTLLNLSAIGLYALVVAACIGASIAAANFRQIPRHTWIWAGLAVFFLGVAGSRWWGIEVSLTEGLREFVRHEHRYAERRSFQKPLVAALLMLAAAIAFVLTYRARQLAEGRRNVAILIAVSASAIMLGLISLRIISLSMVDRLLYGPVKLNWVFDIGSTIAVLAAAGYYIVIVSGRK